jgi:hypothetical protein
VVFSKRWFMVKTAHYIAWTVLASGVGVVVGSVLGSKELQAIYSFVVFLITGALMELLLP